MGNTSYMQSVELVKKTLPYLPMLPLLKQQSRMQEKQKVTNPKKQCC